MFDGVLADVVERRAEEPAEAATLPWEVIALLFCLAAIQIAAAMLYPDLFAAPLDQF
ncbi:MAG TPA: hypothetical protein VGG57_08320 [Stellaceae bacterium]